MAHGKWTSAITATDVVHVDAVGAQYGILETVALWFHASRVVSNALQDGRYAHVQRPLLREFDNVITPLPCEHTDSLPQQGKHLSKRFMHSQWHSGDARTSFPSPIVAIRDKATPL